MLTSLEDEEENTQYGHEVILVEYVVNPALEGAYARKKREMAARLGSAGVNERLLFHGTSFANSEGILRENFRLDRIGCENGLSYGKGFYLSESCGMGRAWQMLPCTAYDCNYIWKRGFNTRWMTWRAIALDYVRQCSARHRMPINSVDEGYKMRVDDVAGNFCWSLEMGLNYAEHFAEDGALLLAKVLVGGADPTRVYQPCDRLLGEYLLTVASCPVPSD